MKIWRASAFAAIMAITLPVPAGSTRAQAPKELWIQRYDDRRRFDEAVKVAADSAGNVIVTGFTYYGPFDENSVRYMAKYAAANGALLWQRRDLTQGACDLALDRAGNVAIADDYIAKYAAADGVLLWKRDYNALAASSVALDAAATGIESGLGRSLALPFRIAQGGEIAAPGED
jgi:hypothetical protein